MAEKSDREVGDLFILGGLDSYTVSLDMDEVDFNEVRDEIHVDVIKVNGECMRTVEDAEDDLAGCANIPGFLYGYVDSKEHRVIAFFKDFGSHGAKSMPGQEYARVTVGYDGPLIKELGDAGQ